MTEKLTLYNNTLSPFKTNENGDKLISGLAVHEGTYHDIIKVSADEISNATNSIVNATLLKDHNGICDNAIGKVTFAKNYFDEEAGKMATYYEGFVDSNESDLIRKIKLKKMKSLTKEQKIFNFFIDLSLFLNEIV